MKSKIQMQTSGVVAQASKKPEPLKEPMLPRASADQALELSNELLRIASIAGPKETMERLLEAGADVNAKNKDGETVLMFAAALGRQEVAEMLITAGADLNLCDKNGVAPLMRAAGANFIGMARLLISHGADANASDRFGETTIFRPAMLGFREIVEALIAAGAKVDDKAIHIAEMNGHDEIVEMLKIAKERCL
ncbi:ankyrin repeat domain-containing protein [Candidatus Micrarchaeota archaeon]|nr:ankyrin repeat domain-containing protein [Candidatus Micrarchaeota archaeon]